jgi:histidine triad (HIT) family protein
LSTTFRSDPDCLFCKIVAEASPGNVVFKTDELIAILDIHPLFPGHVLLCPRQHYETLLDLPVDLTGPMMAATQLLAKAVEAAVDADGTFIAINNRVSQTVPHLHIHVVPRRRRDGLKGFFWPRVPYRDEAARETVRAAIEREVDRLRV